MIGQGLLSAGRPRHREADGAAFRWRWRHSAAAATAGGVAAVVLFLPAGGLGPAEAQRYAEQVHEVALAAGTIIELEMKPGIADIRDEAFPPDTLASFAERWSHDLQRIHDDLEAADVPRALRDTQAGFLASLLGYVDVADLLREASLAGAGQQEDLLDQAMALGADTDQVWNAARDDLEAELGALGLDSPL